MSDKNTAIVMFDQHEQAEQAVKELQRAGFDMKKLSIVSKPKKFIVPPWVSPQMGVRRN
jgi:hypothetical protein